MGNLALWGDLLTVCTCHLALPPAASSKLLPGKSSAMLRLRRSVVPPALTRPSSSASAFTSPPRGRCGGSTPRNPCPKRQARGGVHLPASPIGGAVACALPARRACVTARAWVSLLSGAKSAYFIGRPAVVFGVGFMGARAARSCGVATAMVVMRFAKSFTSGLEGLHELFFLSFTGPAMVL